MKKESYTFGAIFFLFISIGVSWLLFRNFSLEKMNEGWLPSLLFASGVVFAISLFYCTYRFARKAIFFASLKVVTTVITLTEVSFETDDEYIYLPVGDLIMPVPNEEYYTHVECEEYGGQFSLSGHQNWMPGDRVEITIFTDESTIHDYRFH